jgi:hypothetical protein
MQVYKNNTLEIIAYKVLFLLIFKEFQSSLMTVREDFGKNSNLFFRMVKNELFEKKSVHII